MPPGNTADVFTLLPLVEDMKKRFGIGSFCIVADRGMISNKAITELESDENDMLYILGARMRRVKTIQDQVMYRPGRYTVVHEEGVKSKDPSPLKVKQVELDGQRYIVCENPRQARKEARNCDTIPSDLKEQLKKAPKALWVTQVTASIQSRQRFGPHQ